MAGAVTNDRQVAGGLALRGFAPSLDPNWNCWMDENLLKLSSLAQGSAVSRTLALPDSPPDNLIFIVPADATDNANEVAVRDAGAYVFYPPFVGLNMFVQADNQFVVWTGTEWLVSIDLNSSAGAPTLTSLPDTPNSLVDNEGRQLVVNSAEDAFVFRDIPYDVPIFTPGRPAPGAVIRILISRRMVLPADFAGSLAMAGAAAAADALFVVRKSGADIGEITFAAGTPGGLFATASTDPIEFMPGESLEIVNPDPQDETLQDMSYTFLGRQL